MNIDLSLLMLLSATVTIIMATIMFYADLITRRRKKGKESYSERLEQLTGNLTQASKEVDSILAELATVASNRETNIRELETNLTTLEGREKELKGRVEALQNTPLPVADYFAKLVEGNEKRSAKRDYLLFGLGVIVTTIISLILQWLR